MALSKANDTLNMELPKTKIGQTKLLVVAIDLGTTYSGYAFSFHDEPLKISTNQAWVAGFDRLMSLKTPTCVLLNPDKEFDSFGYEAENNYSELAEDDQHHGWYFFRRFKMLLYDTKGITADTTIGDVTGQTMPALLIFEHSIRYLKDHCLNSLKKRITELDETDIQYVLTVPAIWDDKAKMFMRKAAIQAGIPSDQLRMALEPEVASVWCQVESEKEYMDIGRKYMVVDLGGGTADITVNERNDDGTLKELHKATGGSWGGTNVDKNFESFLSRIFGEDAVEELKNEDMGDYLNILRSFEAKKRNIKSTGGRKVVIWVPARLREIFNNKGQDLNERLARLDLASQCEIKGDKLKVEVSVVLEWFKGPLSSVINHLRGLFAWSDISDVDTILLVGGFAESQLVQETIQAAFPDKKVVTPTHDVGLVVLKGAVKFGHFPGLIAARKSKCAYGVGIASPFDADIHPIERKYVKYGKVFCSGLFSEMVARNDSIPYGQRFTHTLVPLSEEQLKVSITLYESDRVNTRFCDDDGCRELGEIVVDLPRYTNIPGKKSKVYVSFWDTEIKFQVKQCKTGRWYEKMLDNL